MLNGVGTNISMAYTSKYNKKSTGDKMDIEFEIGNSEQNSLNKCGERQSELTEIYMNMLSENNSSLYNKLVNNKNAVEQVAPDKEIPNDKLKNIGMTSFGLSDTESQIVLASYVKTSKEDDPVVQVAYGHGDNRKVYHVHVNDVDTSNASDLEMFALMSYEGYKGRTAPNSINNYSAYKTMKADAGYGMASADENSFVNKKVRHAWREYLDSLNEKSPHFDSSNSFRLDLLSEMAVSLGYKNLKQTEIDRFYSPKYFGSQMSRQEILFQENLRILTRSKSCAESFTDEEYEQHYKELMEQQGE